MLNDLHPNLQDIIHHHYHHNLTDIDTFANLNYNGFSQPYLLRYPFYYKRFAAYNKIKSLTCEPYLAGDYRDPHSITYVIENCNSLKLANLGGAIGKPQRLTGKDLKKIAVAFPENTSVTKIILWDT